MGYFWLLVVLVLIILYYEKIKQFYISIKKRKGAINGRKTNYANNEFPYHNT